MSKTIVETNVYIISYDRGILNSLTYKINIYYTYT